MRVCSGAVQASISLKLHSDNPFTALQVHTWFGELDLFFKVTREIF